MVSARPSMSVVQRSDASSTEAAFAEANPGRSEGSRRAAGWGFFFCMSSFS